MNRLKRLFSETRETGAKLLSTFVTAGYPERDSLPGLVSALAESGADFVEVGIPFSDPIADGPTIQSASFKALANGMTLSLALDQVGQIRKTCDIPLLLMGYFNPMLHFGLHELVKQAEEVGIDGFIIPDLLPEDYQRYHYAFDGASAGINFLVSPNTRSDRIPQIDTLTDSFVYCVSVTGVTGARRGVPGGILGFLDNLGATLSHPRMVGFGISEPGDAAAIASHCDGVIVGSAIIKALAQDGATGQDYTITRDLVSELKQALKGVGDGYR